MVTTGAASSAEGIQNDIGLNLGGHSYFLPPDASNSGIIWLTSYAHGENVVSPKLVATSMGFALLWERFTMSGEIDFRGNHQHVYQDTWYMLLNADGSVAKPAARIEGNPRLSEQDRIWYKSGVIYWTSIQQRVCTVNALAILDVPGMVMPSVDPDPIDLDGAADWALPWLEIANEAGLLHDEMAGNWEATTTRLLAAEVLANLVETVLDSTIDEIAEEKGWDLSKYVFADTDSKEAAFLAAADISTGTGNGNFGAADELGRDQWILLLWRTAVNVFEIDMSSHMLGTVVFDDIWDDWDGLNEAVGWAYEAEITTGRDIANRLFGSAEDLENQQTGTFLARTYKYAMGARD
jgi:hypothetical protein